MDTPTTFIMNIIFFNKFTLKQWKLAFFLICFVTVFQPAIAVEHKGLPKRPMFLPGKIKRDSNGKIYLEPRKQPIYIPNNLKKAIKTETLYKNWVKLSWIAPTQLTNGKPLHNLAGYRIYYWTAHNSEKHIRDVKNALSYKFDNLNYGETYYFTVTAYTKKSAESDFSEIIAVKLEKPIEK